MSELAVLVLELRTEHDVVLARQRARDIAERLGFDVQDQTRIATVVSELARNAVRYASGGRIVFTVEERDGPRWLVVRVSDDGPGIRDLDAVLEGRFRSTTGMGIGLMGARRLSDSFDIESAPGGTKVTIGRRFPARAAGTSESSVRRIAEEVARREAQSPFEEVQAQNQELIRTLEELRLRQVEIERLNRELQETNRGVLVLYAELDDKAEALRVASEQKSRFLSNVSHELRTPLATMVNLARILVDSAGAEFTADHHKQAQFIRDTAQGMVAIVNDLLDIAKVEAGRIDIRPSAFALSDFLAGLRGMFRPLLTSPDVALVVEEPAEPIEMHTDEARLAQVVRNLVSNALKFTERGEVRVRTEREGDGLLAFHVSDTGIGIAESDQGRIFEEFTQLEHPLQRRLRGTGLGLPLARQLARLLGGSLAVCGAPGEGSTFSLRLPQRWMGDAASAPAAEERTGV
jgi:signal transduction histidine kinase